MSRNDGVARYHNQLLVARILAGRYNLELVVDPHATTARTNGHTLWYPAQWTLAADDDMSVVMDGAIDHEAAGHGRHTNFKIRRSKVAIVSRLENIFEDIRVETRAGRDWPGIPANLGRLVEVLVRWGFFGSVESALSDASNPGRLLCNGLLTLCRSRLLAKQGDHLGPIAEAYWPVCASTFGPVWNDIWALALTAPSLTSTKSSIDLAEAVYQLLEASSEAPREKRQQSPKDGADTQPGRRGAQGDGNSGPPKKPEADSEQDKPAQSRAGGRHPQDSEAQRSEPSRGQQQAIGQPAEGSTTETDGTSADGYRAREEATDAQRVAAKRATQSAEVELPETDLSDIVARHIDSRQKRERAYTGKGMVAEERPGERAIPPSWGKLATRVGNSVGGELELLLEAKADRRTRLGFNGTAIDAAKAYRLRVGDARIFRRKRQVEDVNTAVALLLDMSPSMGFSMGMLERVMMSQVGDDTSGGNRAMPGDDGEQQITDGSAGQSGNGNYDGDGDRQNGAPLQVFDVKRNQAAGGVAYALANILSSFEVPFEVIEYSSSYTIVKHFEDHWADVRKSQKAVRLTGKDTLTGSAMTVALARLMEQDQEKKLLICVSDGAARDSVVVETAYRFARSEDIQVVTIFIGQDVRGIAETRQILARTGFGNAFSIVKSPSELARGIVDAVRTYI
ncbi:VWA domain-containing protein [Burkholderia sp. MBR-1]|uniref:VWA domain-containing protein n=1 Tax=Burkholderia sp. MBR-1 TaxID=2732364 RepID=UPI0015EEEF98|nr:VWA domain-containing protein [Burkholderia sp. MBR-1]QMI49679.1 VWA domain-containing protein [Burkholderia sp. MBR-1]